VYGYYNNERSIGVEHEVTLTNPNSWTEPMLRASADMARYFADRYQIPKTRPAVKADEPGIRGHNDMPGTNTRCLETFPWDTWMSYFSGGGSSGNISNFDGAGSLIDSSQDCDGCQKDVAKMHPHDNSNPSTVVFQWKNDSKCDHIEISTKSDIGEVINIGEVIIQSRAWNNPVNTIAYRGSLPLSVPQQGSWNITAITSTGPITTSTRVIARCKQSYESYYSGNPITPELVGFDFGYYWMGNGSLMSFAGTGTGKTEDFVITSDSHKSLTVFQWYASDSCSQVRISDRWDENAVMPLTDEVAFKLWNSAEKWKASGCSSIPCFITAPSNGYYLVKIKTDPGAVPNGQLKMTCF